MRFVATNQSSSSKGRYAPKHKPIRSTISLYICTNGLAVLVTEDDSGKANHRSLLMGTGRVGHFSHRVLSLHVRDGDDCALVDVVLRQLKTISISASASGHQDREREIIRRDYPQLPQVLNEHFGHEHSSQCQ